MTVQQLKYILKVAEVGSITEAAKLLFISQPSLSNSIKETETEAGITIFLRSRTGITLTKDGAEFLGYARQVIQQMELLEGFVSICFCVLVRSAPDCSGQSEAPVCSSVPLPMLHLSVPDRKSVV